MATNVFYFINIRSGQSAELASIYVQLAANDGSFATGNVYGSGGCKAQA